MCSVIITIVAVVVAVRRCMCGCNIMLRLLLLLWLWLLAIVFFCCFNVGVCWVLFASCCFLLVGQLVGWSVGRFLGLCSYLSLRHFFLAVSLPAFLPSFLPSCLPAFLPSCLPACLPACLSVCLSCLCWVVCVLVSLIVCLLVWFVSAALVAVLCMVLLFVWLVLCRASLAFYCWPFLGWSCSHVWLCLPGCCFCWLRSIIWRTSIACMSAWTAHMIKYQPVVIKQQAIPPSAQAQNPTQFTPSEGDAETADHPEIVGQMASAKRTNCPPLLSFNVVWTLAP